MQMFNFSNRTVLITGGGSGVGLEAARLFSRSGADVIIMGRSKAKLLNAQAEIGSDKVYIIVGDVIDSDAADKAVKYSQQITGRPVDILVNNAGIILRKTAEETSDEDWAHIMAVNVTGVFNMSRAAAHQMPSGGSIVNLSSTCGRYGAAGLAAYCASKGAVDQLTRTMALELAPRKITVNAAAPGAINSPMLFSEHASKAMQESVVERNEDAIPIGNVAEPAEIARAILYLASEPHITGSILRIDGGYTAQ